MSLYEIILNVLKDDTSSFIHLMEHDRERIAKKLTQEIEEHDNINLLESCAYMRNVSTLQHRTIHEFSQFVEDVMAGKGELIKYQFDWNDRDAIRTWIQKFHEYYKEMSAKWEF